jgi:hypothetical protein
MTDTMDSQHLEACADTCTQCAKVCLKTFYTHCLEAGGEHVRREHVQLMTDCIMICKLAANFLMRGSERHVETCRLCAEICRACAADCETMPGMEECARTCRQCADSCASMAQVGGRL